MYITLLLFHGAFRSPSAISMPAFEPMAAFDPPANSRRSGSRDPVNFFFGVATVQTSFYFRKFVSDPRGLKLLVKLHLSARLGHCWNQMYFLTLPSPARVAVVWCVCYF